MPYRPDMSKREIQEKLDAGRRRIVRQMYVSWAKRDLGMKFASEEQEDRFVCARRRVQGDLQDLGGFFESRESLCADRRARGPPW